MVCRTVWELTSNPVSWQNKQHAGISSLILAQYSIVLYSIIYYLLSIILVSNIPILFNINDSEGTLSFKDALVSNKYLLCTTPFSKDQKSSLK